MKNNFIHKHIVLVGFKSVGKSTVASLLSRKMRKGFIDLDREIEREYLNQEEENFTCREIVKKKGEAYFRELESFVLERVLKSPSSVVALGGGAVIVKKNRNLIKKCVIVHIKADKQLVYERTVAGGRPAYYDSHFLIESRDPSLKLTKPLKSMKSIFNEIWEAREKLYKEVASITSDNSSDVKKTVQDILNSMNRLLKKHDL